jgi:hypothetical protein
VSRVSSFVSWRTPLCSVMRKSHIIVRFVADCDELVLSFVTYIGVH